MGGSTISWADVGLTVAISREHASNSRSMETSFPGVHAVTSLRWLGGIYKDPGDPKNRFGQFAIEPASLVEVYPELRIAEPEKAAFIAQKTACIASRALA